MRTIRGASLKPIATAPGSEGGEAQELLPNINQADQFQANSGSDDLEDLPEAPKAMAIAPNAPSNAKVSDDFDLDSLPDARGSLGKVFDQVSHVEPDHAAKVLDVSQKSGADPALVQANLKDASKGVSAPPDNFFQSIEDKFPGTTKFLKTPENMAVSHDDIPNIAKHEQLVKGITQAMDIADSIKAGFQGSALGLKSRGALPDTELAPDAPIWNRLAAQAAGLAGDFPAMVAGGAAGAAPGATVGAIAGSPLGIPGAALGGFIGGIFGGGAGAFAAPAFIKEHLRQQYEKGDIHGVADALERAGNDLNAATKQGLVGGLSAAVGFGVSLPFESAAAKAIAPMIFESKALKATLPVAAEIGTMTKAGAAVEGKETKAEDYLDTALMIVAMHGATHFGSVAAEHYVEAKKTAQAQQFYDGLGEAGGTSKLLERLPPGYQSMLGGLTKDSPVKSVHIPQEAFDQYFQSQNIDPKQAAEELGISEPYAQAQKTGGTVSIPTSDFVSKIVKTEHYQGLRDDIKFDPEGLTVNEVKAQQKEIKEQLKQEEAKAQEGKEELSSDESAQKIFEEREQQLLDSGHTPQEAKMAATLHSRAFKTLAERSGQDPYELSKRFDLEVKKREASEALGEKSFGQEQPVDHDKAVQETFNAPDVAEKYLAMPETNGGRDIDPDLLRSLYEPYAKDREGKILHLERTTKPAADLAQKIYESQLKAENKGPVILMAGGTASGKTTYRTSYSPELEGLPSLYDTNSANYAGTKERIQQALDSGREVIMNLAYKPFDKAVEGNAARFKATGRLVHPHYMAFTHVHALETFLRLAKEFEGDKRVSFAAFEHDEAGKPIWFKKAVESLEALRYTSDGKSVNVAIKELEKQARERLKDELAEVRHTKTAAADSSGSAGATDERPVSSTDIRGSDETGGKRSFEQSTALATTGAKNSQSPLGFYSQLEHEVGKMDFKSMPAKDLAGRIKNLSGIKQEELEFTGLNDYLKLKSDVGEKVTKEEIQQFLKDKGVKVEQVVKSQGFEEPGVGVGDIEWDEPSRDTSNDSDNISSEMDYYIDSPEDAFGEETLAEWKAEADKENTDADGNIDEAAAKEALDDKIRNEAEKRATEYVEGDDYPSAYYHVVTHIRNDSRYGNRYYSLHGSDEFGWSDDDGKEYGYNLNEAKIRFAAHLLDKGVIEGDRSQLIKEKEIDWKKPHAAIAPNEGAITRRANQLIKNDRARLEAKAKEENSYNYGNNVSPKDQEKNLKEDVAFIARDEARDYYKDPTNPKNTVEVSIDHGILEGSIKGNDKNGYTLNYESQTVKNNRHELEAKTLEEAKKEAVAKIIANGDATANPAPVAADPNAAPVDPNAPTGKSKWHQYVVPGGTNYREVLLTLPSNGEGKDFSYTSHFSEKNIIAHVRLTDRVDAQGRKVLFGEEMQSDYSKEGRDRGYATKETPAQIKDLETKISELQDTASNFNDWMKDNHPEIKEKDVSIFFAKPANEYREAYDKAQAAIHEKVSVLNDERRALQYAVPDAPFIKNSDSWTALALKRMIRMAVEQGYDAFSWTPSHVHIKRWGTDDVTWTKSKGGGFEVIDHNDLPFKDIGKFDTKAEAEAALEKIQNHVENKKKIMEKVEKFNKDKGDYYDLRHDADSAIRVMKREKLLSKQEADDIELYNGINYAFKDSVGKFTVKEVGEHWLVGSVEQRGGVADGVDIEALARARGELLERDGVRVTDKQQLRDVIASALSREKKEGALDSLTERVWKQMNEGGSASGAIKPRAEGLALRYDKTIPDVAKKLLKQLDPNAKIEVGAINTDSDLTHSDMQNGTEFDHDQSMKALEIPLTDKLKEKVMEGQSLFQPNDQGKSPRGRITFQRDKAVIELFKDANRSTFLHESGHYFLEIMQHLANEETAPQSLKDDVKAIRDWMGLKDGETIGTAEHEQFARGFEAYLMDGKAPSEPLRQAFAKFKQWLIHIYRSIKDLNVQLSPDIRGVMDRMLATDDEISRAQEASGYRQANGLEVPAEVKPRLDSLAFQAREQAESELMREQMKELSAKHKDFLKSERQKLITEAESQVRQEPVYQAIDYIKEQIGKRSVLSLAKKMLEGKINDEDAVHFETAAEAQGVFADGKDLALNIVNSNATDHFNKAVQEIVRSGMAQHADLMNTGDMKAKAMAAVHNEKLTELLALERNILSDKVKQTDINQEVSKRNRIETRIQVQAAKEQAKEILDQKPIKDAGNARIYVTAERNAAAKSAVALAREDFAKASEYKRQQMLNHALASEAMRNREASDKAISYLEDAANRKNDLQKMPYAFNRQIDQILERFGFKQKEPEDTTTLKQIAVDMLARGEDPLEIANDTGMIIDPQSGQWRPETLRDFVNRVNDNYVGLQIPDSVLNGSGVDDFRDLKMAELRELKDAVQLLKESGQKYNRFLNDFIRVDMKEAAAAFKKSVQDLIGSPYAENRKIGSKFDSEWKQKIENLKNLPDAMIPSLVNTLTLCHYLDGGAQGPAHDFIYRPMKEAEDRKFARYEKMREDLTGENGLFGQFYTPKELADYKKEATKYGSRSITKENILAMALNWGNEANRDRIRSGYGSRDSSGRLVPMSDGDIEALFKHLGKKDWDFAQATWNYLDTYWPEISALEMKMRGVEPKRVEPVSFVNEHGAYSGGYYPIAYEFEKSSEAFKNEQAKNELYKQYSASSAQTESGHTQARVSFVARPVRLSLDVLFNHLENVIHDLEFRPSIVDTSKFLAMADVKKTIEDGVGMSAKRGLDQWLKSIASDQSENLTWIEKALTWTRFGTTISTLGLTPKAFLLHLPSNVFNSMWEIGVKDTTSMMTRAALDVAMGRGNLKDFVFSKSERMKQRLTVRDRDIMDMAKAWQGKALGVIPHYAFMSLHLADEAVSVPLWAEVYKKNIADLGEKGAAELADETVTRTLGSGSKVDQINLQRGGGAKKLFTMFYSWMSVMFNRAWLDGKMAGLEYRKENVGAATAILAKAAFYGFALPAIHEALLGEALHNSQQTNEDDRKKRMMGTIIEQPFSMIPFVRDISGPIIHKTLGEHGGDYRMSPVETAIQNIYSPLADGARIAFTDKEMDEKYAEEVARGMSQAIGYPQQLNSWAFNLWDYVQNNGEASMKDFLSRRKKK